MREKPATSPLGRSLLIQSRVVYALLLREVITRYGRHNIGFFWMFIEPMLFTLGVTALWTALKAIHGSDIPITAFALTGYSSVLLWRNMPGRTVGAIEPNLALMFHRNVKAIDIFLARVLLEFLGNTISFIVLAVVFTAFGLMDPPEDVLKVANAWFMLAWFALALGLLAGALAQRFEVIEKVWHTITYLTFPLSGAAFLVEGLSPGLREIVLWLPMVHGVEYLRDGYFGSHFTATYNLEYMAVVSLAMTAIALAEIRTISKRITST